MGDRNADPQALGEVLESLEEYRVSKRRLKIQKESLGSGGFGDVKLATLADKRWFSRRSAQVAVKQIRASGTDEEQARVTFSFARELKIWAVIDHPNILRFIGFHLDFDMKNAWLISDYAENGNIRDYLDKVEPSDGERLTLATDAANGLAYLHRQGICHGDIKAANVLVSNAPHRAMLCDFGLAKVLADGPTGLTTTTSIKGSTRYLAPELINENLARHSRESDVWAWACLLLEIILDMIPHSKAPTDLAVLGRMYLGELPATINCLPIVDALKLLLSQCWTSQPALRPTMEYCIISLGILSVQNMLMLPISASITMEDLESLGSDLIPAVFKKSGLHWNSVFTPALQRMVDIGPGSLLSSLPSSTRAMHFSADGNHLALGMDGEVRIFDFRSGSLIRSLRYTPLAPGATWDPETLSFSPSGTLLLTSGFVRAGGSFNTSPIHLWDVATGSIVDIFLVPGGNYFGSQAFFSRDGNLIAYTSSGQVRTYDRVATVHKTVGGLSFPGLLSLAISPNSQRIATGHRDGFVRVADARSGALLITLGYQDAYRPARGLTFALDGKRLVSGHGDCKVEVWNLSGLSEDALAINVDRQTPVPERTLVGHKNDVTSVAFSPDGLWLVSRSSDGEVRFWDPATGQTEGVLSFPGSGSAYLSVSPVITERGWLVSIGLMSHGSVQIFGCKPIVP